jgi:hypothetical protein
MGNLNALPTLLIDLCSDSHPTPPPVRLDYERLQQPISNRAQEDARLIRLIRASFIASHGIYGGPRVFLDLRLGERNL